MRFSLTIDCDNAAFQPARDDASEADRIIFAGAEAANILRSLAGRLPNAIERSGVLRDINGNRCGAWSLREEEAPKGVYWAMREETYLGDPAWSLFEDGQRVAVGLTKADAARVCLAMNGEPPAGRMHAETSTDANQAHADHFAAQQEADARAEAVTEAGAILELAPTPAAAIVEAIDRFHDKTEADEHTDTGEAWDLLSGIRTILSEEPKPQPERLYRVAYYRESAPRGWTLDPARYTLEEAGAEASRRAQKDHLAQVLRDA